MNILAVSLAGYYRKKLAFLLNGETEVVTLVGQIDIVTSLLLIEVKLTFDWQAGFSQLIACGGLYPQHKKLLYLIGEPASELEDFIATSCHKAGVQVFYQNSLQSLWRSCISDIERPSNRLADLPLSLSPSPA